MARYTAIDIAHWFISKNQYLECFADGAGDLTILKLIKLVYYAEGCSLALDRDSLFDESILAWEHGPAIESIWLTYNSKPFKLKLKKADLHSIEMINANIEDRNLLEEVFEVFGQYSAWALREKTRKETPWVETTLNGIIGRDLIKNYFKEHYIIRDRL